MELNFYNERLTKEVSYGKFFNIISRRYSYYLGKKMEKYNINKNEYHYLINIYIKDNLYQEELANLLKVDKFEVAKAVKSLIEKGFVYKEKDKVDKRKFRLHLTEKASLIKEEFKEILEESSNMLTHGMTKEEKKELERLLQIVMKNVVLNTESIKNK